MDSSGYRLRKQVVSEIRRRKLIFLTGIFLCFLYLFISILFGDMGFLKYRDLHKKKTYLETQIREFEQDNKQLRSQVQLIKEDPYYKEKHAREDYGLVKPGELIIQYDR